MSINLDFFCIQYQYFAAVGIYQGMYTPTNWPALAQSLAEVAAFLDHTSSTNNSTFNSTDDNNVTTTVERRSLRSPIFDFPILPRDTSTNNNTSNSTNTNTTTTDDPAPDYAFQGVTCGDAIDAGDVTTKNVFDYLVNVTRTVSQMCMRDFIFSVPSVADLAFSWPCMG